MPTSTPYFPICKWSDSDRPREKLRFKGSSALTDAELLAILIGSGNPGETAVHLMQRILASLDNDMGNLHTIPFEHLVKWKGIGPAKAIKIKAALEIGKRIQNRTPVERLKCNQSKDAYFLFKPELTFLDHEEFWVAYLNHQHQVITHQCISKGGIAATTVDIRLNLKKALEVGGAALILAHNHPTGILKPSRADIEITEKVKKAAAVIDIQLLDHLIVSEKGYFSFADKNTL